MSATICRQMEFAPVNGVLMDLGLSSFQLAEGEGFSFPATRRWTCGSAAKGSTAEDIVNTYSEAELADLIFQYGEEPASRRIARRIVEAALYGRPHNLPKPSSRPWVGEQQAVKPIPPPGRFRLSALR